MLMTELEPHRLPQIDTATLPTDSVVVCATLRLAQTLAKTHDASAENQSSWRSLNATTLGQWLHALYDALVLRGQAPPSLVDRRVLNTFQEQLVWEKVIRQQIDTALEPLFDLKSLAASAAQAHKLSIEWNIPVDGGALGGEEQRQFQQWQEAFRAHCQQQGLIDVASLHARLIDHLPAVARTLLPTTLAFAGFDHYTALEYKLQAQLQSMGIATLAIAPPSAVGKISRVEPADLAQECLAIASWAQQHLAAKPHARLGIVIPGLETYQQPLQDALEDMLAPALIMGRHAHQPRPFNISLGQPLSNTPIVHTALTLLQLITQAHDVEQTRFATLLHSPYWSQPSNPSEADARARLDAACRSSIAFKAPLDRYDRFANWYLNEHKLQAPELRQHLNALRQAARSQRGSRPPSEWRRSLEALLAQCGWLADGKLNSIEFQTRQAFVEALNELARLDQMTGKLTLKETVGLLNQLCNERLFQPKTRGNPNIQILGILESTGLAFDALWFAGLTEAAWPPAAHPNPLLSVTAQRQQQAPNACASVQLDFAQRIQHRLLRSAPEIMVSAPRMEGDTELQPSALITRFTPTELACNASLPWVQAAVTAVGLGLESLEDATAPAVDPGAHVRGGTWLLRAQAICPAWGYFQFRLGAVPLQKPVEGLDARQRGTLVHDALEAFWNATRDQAGLQSLVRSGLANAVEQAVHQALDAYNANQQHEPLKPRQRVLELNRLQRLLNDWLMVEATRTEPFTVLYCEHEFKDNISGIEVRMFLDRIDQLADGRLLIIDYKTGASIDTRNWASERLTEPQLPIYAAIANPPEGDVAGVAFAQVHLSKLGFKGVGDAEGLLPGVDDLRSYQARKLFNAEQFPDWQSVLTHWETAVYKVAEEVCAGDASVRYMNDKDLMYCDVKPLLRLAERAYQLDAAMDIERRSGGPL